MNTSAYWVVFSLDEGRYALRLTAVERIVRAAYVTPLPGAPDMVLGAMDVAGRVLPVFNLRRKFRLPERTVHPTDQFLIARTLQRTVVLHIDSAQGVLDRPATELANMGNIAPNLGHIEGVIQLEDGLVLIHDLEQFLSPEEALSLDEAMNQQTRHAC
ncbi:MAG TPA: chemotaxis protein CheW [Steroidobacteraceae bacterium]